MCTDRTVEGSRWGIQIDQPQSSVTWIPLDPARPNLDRFPKLEHTSPLHVKVLPGETLFLPSLWFHRVGAREGTVTVAVNYWHDMRFDCKWVYFQFLQRLATQHLENREEHEEENAVESVST